MKFNSESFPIQVSRIIQFYAYDQEKEEEPKHICILIINSKKHWKIAN